MDIYRRLCDIGGEGLLKVNEPMRKHTTFRVGGEAKFFFSPNSKEQIVAAVAFCKEVGIPYYIIGNGSNLLVSDKGIEGVVIQLGQSFSQLKVDGNEIFAQAGVLLSKLAREAANCSLTGLEFAAGIPGTLGGGLTMNAGAYGGEMKDVILSAELLNQDGEIITLNKEELGLGYRSSIITKQGCIALGAKLSLESGVKETILARMKELNQMRKEKQPLEYPSGGSTFKRPVGHFAGKLVMDAGLAGYSIGGAEVSEKHCGFIINKGDACASDIFELCAYVKDIVNKQFGVSLEMEVKTIGEF